MDELEKILEELRDLDLDAYRRVIRLCQGQARDLSGVPAIIGLDDLTTPDKKAFRGAGMDERMRDDLARDAMVLTWLYDEVPERDHHYPPVALAMSALAEKTFAVLSGEELPRSYGQLLETWNMEESCE